jgi:hypothetical protein
MNPNNNQNTPQPDNQPLPPNQFSQPVVTPYEETPFQAPEQPPQTMNYFPQEQTAPQPLFMPQPTPKKNHSLLWISLVVDIALIGVTTWFLVTNI